MDRKSATIIGYWLLLETGFGYKERLSLSRVGCHPDNREKQMIIIANVQSLMEMMSSDGYNEDLFKGMVQETPLDGREWQAANARLWDRSDGYLASSNQDDLRYYTVMGSHSTSAFRAFKYGVKTSLSEYADAEGMLMVGKLFDKQPSLKVPVEQGCMYEPDTKIYPAMLSI